MSWLAFSNSFLSAPGLLVSVRNAAEARAALEGGADVIDVKEPARGSLGAASPGVIQDVVRAVAGQKPVTAALGELLAINRDESVPELSSLPRGIALAKLGLSGCRDVPNWRSLWHDALAATRTSGGISPQPVAVVYADWTAACAPQPAEVLQAAVGLGCPALLIDTWDKSSGDLFEHWPKPELSEYIQSVQRHGIAVVLAGSLCGAAFAKAVRMAPSLVAVRGAACRGSRTGTVAADLVRDLKQAIASQRQPSAMAEPAH